MRSPLEKEASLPLLVPYPRRCMTGGLVLSICKGYVLYVDLVQVYLPRVKQFVYQYSIECNFPALNCGIVQSPKKKKKKKKSEVEGDVSAG